MILFLRDFFLRSERNAIVYKNTALSFLFRGGSIIISFISIPLYLKAVDSLEYGIILTITSVIGWISFFDIGIGNGLRNKLGKAIALNDKILARNYVSTAYFYMAKVFLAIFLAYLLLYKFIDWYSILKIRNNSLHYLNFWILIIVIFFMSRFVLQLIGIILLADQKSSLNDAILPLANILSIAIYFILKAINLLNFYTLLLSIVVTPVLVLIAYSIYFYKNKYHWLIPRIKYVDKSLSKDLLGLGFKFFMIQCVSLIIFSTSNILIARLFNISLVTSYTIIYKYYSITIMGFTIIVTPLWGAFTNAWYQNDFLWIKKKIKLVISLCFALIFINIIQYLIYPYFSKIWLGKTIPFDGGLVICLIVYNFIFCYNNIFAFFLNGIGKVTVQMYCAVLGGVLNIPLTIILAKYTHLGLSSIVLANILCLLPSSIFTTIQAFQLLREKVKYLSNENFS